MNHNNNNLPIQSKPAGLVAEGLHLARCYALIQLGTIFIVDKWQAQVRLQFELPYDVRVFRKGAKPAPKTVSKEYAANLYNKSWLKRHLISWLGEEVMLRLDEANNDGFDPFIVVGQPCQLDMRHKQSQKGAWYEDIEMIYPAGPAHVIPEQYNPTQILTFDNFDKNVFANLPEFVQKKIVGSKEYEQKFK